MTNTNVLTIQQRDKFAGTGVLRLDDFYPAADIATMRCRLWGDLERRYILGRDQPQTWSVAMPAGFGPLRRSGAFAAVGSPELRAVADALFGLSCWAEPDAWGLPLVTFPTAAPVLPRPPWHLDIGGLERLSPLPALKVFTFLDEVEPGGGGTLYVAGSHLLALDLERRNGTPVRSAEVRDGLKTHSWFADLLATPSADLAAMVGAGAQIGAHPVRLEEMSGAPGDLIIMHPAVLHGTAHNARSRPRMMLMETLKRRNPAA
ncbi:phytanoyl-CoA dioxygenase family protein [Phenylobacterium sp.]|uniref:phytanoyl-CoA dioxygenase family protein n=1 Tax=Phenylobacterium sp. TaxID=1871053 RepID=UPI0035C78DA5